MKISRIEVYKMSIPFLEPTVTSFTSYTNMSSLAVRVITDDDYVGLAETTAVPFHSGESCESIVAGLEYLAPLVMGEDPRNIRKIHAKMDRVLLNYAAKAGIDIACHDLAAKYYNVPLAMLLGGLFHENFPTEHLVPIRSIPESVAYTQKLVEEGFSIYELKVKGAKDDAERICAIQGVTRRDDNIVVDFNRAGNVKDCIKFIQALDPQYNWYIEQPTNSLDELAEVHKKSPVPIIADELVKSVSAVSKIVEKKAADVLSIKLLVTGGFYPCMQIASYAQAMGMPFRVDDMVTTRFGNTATYVLASVLDCILIGCSTSMLLVDHRDIVPQGLTYDRGIASLEQKPGIGADIDFSRLGAPIAAWNR